MKQHLRSLWTLLLLMMWCSVGFAAETTYNYTFKAGDFSAKKKTNTLNGINWTLAVESWNGSESYAWDNGKGLKIGSSNSKYPKGNVTITTTEIVGTIKKVTVNTSSNASSTTTLKVLVGDTQIGKQQSLTSTAKNFTFEGSATGDIVLSYADSNKPIFIKSISVIYEKGPEPPPTTLTFPKTAISINGGDEASFKGQPAKLWAGEQELTGKTIKYAHTGDGIFATFNTATGDATLKTGVYGTATVTATYEGDETYEKAVASYTVKVVDPNAIETTFDFKKPENYDYGVSSGNNNHKGDLDDNGGQIISNGVVITSTSTNSTPNRFWWDGLRVYDKSTLVVSASGYKITKITTEGGVFDWTYNYDGTAVYNYNASATLTSMTVTMSPLPQVTFTENENNDDALIINDKATVNATLTRTLVANKWNTFCVPFDTEFAGTALEGATVKAVGTIEGNVINLVDADKIEAGVPYLIMPTTGDIVNPTFKSVTITEISAKEVGNDEYKFVGTYSPKPITKDEFGKIWGVTAEGKLAKINADTTMKGLRAYFVFPTNTAAAKLNFDGETTGINNIETNATVNGKVYNLNGQYVGNSLNGLKKGIYVVNGKKVIK